MVAPLRGGSPRSGDGGAGQKQVRHRALARFGMTKLSGWGVAGAPAALATKSSLKRQKLNVGTAPPFIFVYLFSCLSLVERMRHSLQIVFPFYAL